MQAVLLTMVADGLMAVLLVITIFYCLKLNRRIRVLQDSKSEFSRLIERFDNVTKRAQESIAELQTVSHKVDEKLSGKLDKANFLADDLAFMIEKGNKVANRASSSLAGSASTKPSFKDMGSTQGKTESAISASTLAAREKLAAANEKKTRRASIEAVMDRISTSKGQSSSSENSGAQVKGRRTARTHARLRSRAEQELQEAIKSGS